VAPDQVTHDRGTLLDPVVGGRERPARLEADGEIASRQLREPGMERLVVAAVVIGLVPLRQVQRLVDETVEPELARAGGLEDPARPIEQLLRLRGRCDVSHRSQLLSP